MPEQVPGKGEQLGGGPAPNVSLITQSKHQQGPSHDDDDGDDDSYSY